jgi:hypothetical protein
LDSSAISATAIVRYLCGVLGWHVVGTIADVKFPRLNLWRQDRVLPGQKKQRRLRAAYEIHRRIQQTDGTAAATHWFVRADRYLGGMRPDVALGQGRVKEVCRAFDGFMTASY